MSMMEMMTRTLMMYKYVSVLYLKQALAISYRTMERVLSSGPRTLNSTINLTQPIYPPRAFQCI
jgi:hypothetical protein